MKEPPAPASLQTSSSTQLKHSDNPVSTADGYYLIKAEEELEIQIDSAECPEPLILEIRSYSDLKAECSIRGTCDLDDLSYQNDYNCWPLALNCTTTNNKLTCIDSWFYEFDNCVSETISNVQIVRCWSGYMAENNYCVMSNEYMKMPWDDPYLAPCYDSANWNDCPINGNCVGCKARGKYYSDCTAPTPT